ncbi:hypothetical protein PV327_010857 [Microctonus hyperodae]|uniref:Uncharacterized protein n=1 Tax=Microctonus hyperodae TaxID=165561 RepID=A0AA39F0G9_MICHY|nr:hypothetical protein PV327_010857 [Microctonus hyperodae]
METERQLARRLKAPWVCSRVVRRLDEKEGRELEIDIELNRIGEGWSMAFTSISRNLNEYIHRPGGLALLTRQTNYRQLLLVVYRGFWQSNNHPTEFVRQWKKNFGISPFLALENSATGYFLAVFEICRLAPDGSIYFRILTLEVQPLTPDLRLGEQQQYTGTVVLSFNSKENIKYMHLEENVCLYVYVSMQALQCSGGGCEIARYIAAY